MAWETVAELLELLCGWLHARRFYEADPQRAERLRGMVVATARQIEV